MNINNLKDLYQHMQWADATVWASLIANSDAENDSKLRDYFYHLHMVQYAFLRTWRGEPRETPYPTFDNSKALMLWGRDFYNQLFSYLDTLSDEQIYQPLLLPWATMVEKRLGVVPKNTVLLDTMLQVALHSQYHRGQINTRLREIGVEPPLVDYIAWVWLGRPLANKG